MKASILNSVKKYTKIALLLCLPIAMTNCGDDTVTFLEENPLAGYLEVSGFDEAVDTFYNSSNYEFGYFFTPTVNGQINAIVARLPEANPTLRVTIWDFDSKTVLKTVTVNVETANTTVTEAITPLVLEMDKNYQITMNSNDWYNRKRTDGSDVTYPITVDNIIINGYSWITGSTQTFPTNTETDYYAGDASFIFQEIAE
ncbi:MAG: hypothetical protein R2728_10330 [Chitinophagales bacterium]